ncbi:hypothetical protein LguiB_008271 [Lonicera macranthoides]
MNNLASPESVIFSGNPQSSAKCWFDDACILDMDYFIKTLSGIKAKGVRPDLIGYIITHYATKWFPDLASSGTKTPSPVTTGDLTETATSSWKKKKFFVETLVGILPPERDSVACNFLLRLLKMANMVGADSAYVTELEKRISWQLETASLGEMMIPCFNHDCGNLFDVELVIRLVKRFVSIMDEGIKSGGEVIKVGKLVDGYLAEAAVDYNLGLPEFVELAGALPGHARVTHDGLYRAIDTYLKAHPGVSKEERKSLCRLLDSRKLTPEASLHAAQNDRLPVRAVIQALFSEQTKLNGRRIDWSGSLISTPSPNMVGSAEPTGRCPSKREMTAQHTEMRRLKEDVLRLQSQCFKMQGQIERIVEEKKNKMKKKKRWFFKWKKLIMPSFKTLSLTNEDREVKGEMGFGRQTPMSIKKKTRLPRGTTPTRRRKSIS